MRIPVGGAANLFLLLCVPVLLILQGCAGPMIRTAPVNDREAGSVLNDFTQYLETSGAGCSGRLDAEVDATVFVSGWLGNHQGRFTGYLQALEPGYVKYAALNPLGQPVLILVTDGVKFKFLSTLDNAAYTGSTRSVTFGKYFPPAFKPETSYFWLTGRVPSGVEIKKVSRAGDGQGYWLQVVNEDAEVQDLILFDPSGAAILRHVMLSPKGEPLIDVVYGGYQPEQVTRTAADAHDPDSKTGNGPAGVGCRVPATIRVTADSGIEKQIELSLSSFLPGTGLSPDDFKLTIPASLKMMVVD